MTAVIATFAVAGGIAVFMWGRGAVAWIVVPVALLVMGICVVVYLHVLRAEGAAQDADRERDRERKERNERDAMAWYLKEEERRRRGWP